MMTELMLEAPGPNGPLAVFRKTKEQDTSFSPNRRHKVFWPRFAEESSGV